MNLELIGEHTLDTSLLTGGYVLDAGCRNFHMAEVLAERGETVIALDADPTVANPNKTRVEFFNMALMDNSQLFPFHMHHDPQARSVVPTRGEDCILVQGITLKDLMVRHKISMWDAIKLDIEGAEFDVLMDIHGTVTKQISVEFHDHVKPRPPAFYEKIHTHLSKWYRLIQNPFECRHRCAPNYWDTLWVMK